MYTGLHTFQRHASPPPAAADGVDWVLVRSPREDIFSKSSGQILPSGLLRKASLNAGRTTNLAPVKSLESSEFSSEFSDLKTLLSNVKVNPVISWNGKNSFHRIFPSNSQDFTIPQSSFEFSGFYYTSNSFLIKPINTNDWKTRPFREILSWWKGRGEDRVE